MRFEPSTLLQATRTMRRGSNNTDPMMLPFSMASLRTKPTLSWQPSNALSENTNDSLTKVVKHHPGKACLIDFVQHTLHDYAPAGHHHKIADVLEAVERGDIKRLMIFMPPRHGKSQLASIHYPAWYIGRNPTKQIICASYAKELAAEFGRSVRNLINSDEYADVFSTRLSQDSTAAHRWNTSEGGAYIAAGVGGPIVGRGADLLVIDDPIKNREDADSEIYRDRVWNWYRGAARTRLMPGGAIILIQTRWHDDDLAGRLLAEAAQGGEQWHVLELPAISAQGQALWPEWYDVEALEGIRAAVGPREWSAQYQQNPTPDEGDYFKREWLRWYDDAPQYDHLAIYGASDYAVTDDGGDYTVHGVVGVDEADDIYVLDWWRQRTTSDVWVETAIDMMEQWKPRQWGEESGQIIKSIGPFLQRRMEDRRVYCVREQYSSASDKPTRARSIQARMATGKIHFPHTGWAHDLVSELLRFPAGSHDDQVDVMSLFGRMLDAIGKGRYPKRPEPPRGRTMADIDRAERMARLGIRRRVGYYA